MKTSQAAGLGLVIVVLLILSARKRLDGQHWNLGNNPFQPSRPFINNVGGGNDNSSLRSSPILL